MEPISWALILKSLPEIIIGVLQFPDKIISLIRILKSTPTEKHDKILDAAQKESDKFKEEGLPSWD